MRQIVDGNIACSNAAYLFSEFASIYPITPSSPMASNIDSLRSNNQKNLFGNKVEIVQMQSEAGVAGALHGALLSGSLGVTFTSSQGLLLMIPNMYKMAGECLPAVIHVASRTIATHALSIFGDHSDIYATRQTGFCFLSSSNVTDAYYLAIVAHLSALKASLPFLHFFDGFRTSHELNVLETVEPEKLAKLIDKKALNDFRHRSLNVLNQVQYGMAENEDIYFQSVEARNKLYEEACEIVSSYMEEINKIAQTNYDLFEYYGSDKAQNIIVAMGSVCDTIKLVINEENKKGHHYGLITVRLFRPFSVKHLLKVLPSSVLNVAVLDRSKEAGSTGEPLYLDVLKALNGKNINVVGGRYGLSSKNTTPNDIYAVFKMLETNPQNNFTIGINDDVTNLSLPVVPYKIDLHAQELKIYGFGSDGMVSASKDLLKIMGENNYVQGYSQYDSKKSGGETISHLRISKSLIRAPYYVTNTDIIVVTKDTYFQKFHLLESAKEKSIVLVNTANSKDFLKKINGFDEKIIQERHLKLLTIDADALALKYHLNGKISKIMEAIILKLLGKENVEEILNERIKTQFKTKGEDVIYNNQQVVKESLHLVEQVKHNLVGNEDIKCLNIYETINAKEGDKLTVSQVLPLKNGAFPNAMSKFEKRRVSSVVVKWVKENCIQCGMCSFVCPHAVIRPFLVQDQKGIPALGAKNYQYVISISEADCTSCGLCLNICPGKNGKKALTFGSFDEKLQEQANYLFNGYTNPEIFPITTIKGSQLQKPRFEFSGACAGCGETSYIKLLTQLLQDELVIANATGCSSIYGGSAPSTPYSIPWANSLFEDNAEFALGLHKSYALKREAAKTIITNELKASVGNLKDLYNQILNDFDDSKKVLDYIKALAINDIPTSLREILAYLPKRTVWAIGGDGWAYDIGFGGIDHVLSSNENIKILVLDTEVYSNTGGQMSKASQLGQVTEFADLGKRNVKKDLFKIGMCYPNCYVASISLGANLLHTLKTLKEANDHQGPSLVIAYAPCVEQGIKGGLCHTNEEQKLAVQCGYNILMRYVPEDNKLYIDSKEPDFNLYQDFLKREIRYNSLAIKDEQLASKLLKQNQEYAEERYNYYQKMTGIFK